MLTPNWIAGRSQNAVKSGERQEAELRQQQTDSIAALIRAAVISQQQEFVQQVNVLLTESSPDVLARNFSRVLPQRWRPGAIGFAVTTSSAILSPADEAGAGGEFLRDNRQFLGNKLAVEVYQPTPGLLSQMVESKDKQESLMRNKGYIAANEKPSSAQGGSRLNEPATTRAQTTEELTRGTPPTPLAGASRERAAPVARAESATVSRNEAAIQAEAGDDARQSFWNSAQTQSKQVLRKVAPQQQAKAPEAAPASNLNVMLSDFQQVVSGQNEGLLARFVQDQLEILFWTRPPAAPGYVFGAQLLPRDLQGLLTPIVQTALEDADGICVAILDDRARPFASSTPGFSTDWKRPFVATEIGEALPHWEVALYLLDPDRLRRSALLVNATLAALIALALGAIVWGGYMVVGETRKQMALVQKKADFVSNVSHELKTPLTSIRMFAELLHENRVTDPEKREKYLRVITLEADRLTRLINNVLDFARIERNQKRYNKRPVDLYPVLRKIWEAQEMHLQSEGFTTAWHAAPPPYDVIADEDAMGQVVVNLLSNAEKYSTERKEVELHTYIIDDRLVITVLDRGLGVPKDQSEKIFESFYRAHDSLSSGIQGSGLGLTLARRIAREHGGDVTWEPRPGGGSSFTVKIPAQRGEEQIP